MLCLQDISSFEVFGVSDISPGGGGTMILTTLATGRPSFRLVLDLLGMCSNLPPSIGRPGIPRFRIRGFLVTFP